MRKGRWNGARAAISKSQSSEPDLADQSDIREEMAVSRLFNVMLPVICCTSSLPIYRD